MLKSVLLAQQYQDEQLASKVDLITTHNKMLDIQIAQQASFLPHLQVDFLASPNRTLGNIVMHCAEKWHTTRESSGMLALGLKVKRNMVRVYP